VLLNVLLAGIAVPVSQPVEARISAAISVRERPSHLEPEMFPRL
jgi:hypothetical protein